MPFSESDRQLLLAAKGVGPTVIRRLEQLGYSNLADLLEVERELARVQGEIDARSSELNVMRKRIAMSDLTIAYQSRGLFVDDRTADPTLQALRDFLATVSLSFAAAIRFVAVALPWLLIVLPAFWLLRRMWRRRAGKLRSPDS